MTGIPAFTVTVDDGTGTFPIDLSYRVRMTAGLTVSGVGRTDEFSTAQGAQLSVTFDNNDGALSVGGGFDSDPFDSSAFDSSGSWSHLRPGQKIRVSSSLLLGFQGRITALDLGWDGGQDAAAVLTVTATDMLADLSRRILRSMLEEQIVLQGPVAYYTLGEAEGSTTAGDTSGKQAETLSVTSAGTPMVFGQGTGPADGLSAPEFFNGQYLTGSALQSSGTIALILEVNSTVAPAATITLAQAYGWSISMNTAGGVGITGYAPSSGSILDGLTHTVAIRANGSTVSLFLDGTLLGSATQVGTPSPGLTQIGAGFTGTLSHFAVITTSLPTDGDMSVISGIAHGASESTYVRSQRFARYAGVVINQNGLYNDPGGFGPGQLVGPQVTTGKSVIDALNEVATAEGGTIHADQSGVLVFLGRNYRPNQTTPAVTLVSDDLDPDTHVTWDNQQVLNTITVNRQGGATQLVTNGDSVGRYGVFPTSLDTIVAADADALAAGVRLANSHAWAIPRIGSVTVDLMTNTNAYTIVSNTDVGTRIALGSMPSQLWASTADVTVEGWSMTVTHESWTVTYNLLPWSLSAT